LAAPAFANPPRPVDPAVANSAKDMGGPAPIRPASEASRATSEQPPKAVLTLSIWVTIVMTPARSLRVA
jgi:hypothetical protein